MVDPILQDTLLAMADQSAKRISRLELDGRVFWCKRRERLGWRMRLQKGDTIHAFQRELDAYQILADAGLPVPPIVAKRDDLFVIPDCGKNLGRILAHQAGRPEERLQIFDRAARGLAQFHRAGFSHGRPSLKDVLWDGTQIRFIDFERFAPDRTEPGHFAEDVVIMIFNALSVSGQRCAEVDQLVESYRDAGTDEVWELARRRALRMRWLNWITKPIQWRRAGKAKEFKAIPLTLETFAAH